MSAETATQPINTANAGKDADPIPLTKVDSAVQGLSSSPTEEKKTSGHRRTSSSAPGVWNINDLGMYSLGVMFLFMDLTLCLA